MKIKTNFAIPYENQTEEIKAMFCKHDYEKVSDLLGFRNQMRKMQKIKKIIDITTRM